MSRRPLVVNRLNDIIVRASEEYVEPPPKAGLLSRLRTAYGRLNAGGRAWVAALEFAFILWVGLWLIV